MGIIQKYRDFKENRYKKSIAKSIKVVVNPKAIKEERAAAIEFFQTVKEADVAVPALLKRFDYSLEHGINDTREKEAAMEGVVKFEAQSHPFILQHLKSSDRIAWPIKCLKQTATDEQLVEALVSCLDYTDVSLDQSKVDKNYDILCYLRDYKLQGQAVENLFHFLDDLDERVRFAVVEALLEQEHEGIPPKLEKFIKDESAENTRIRQSVVSAFIKHQWKLRNQTAFEVGPLLPGIQINKQFQVVKA